MTSKEQVTDKPVKPDFITLANERWSHESAQSCHRMAVAMNYIWTTHVEPLKEENDKLREALKRAVDNLDMEGGNDSLVTDIRQLLNP